MVWTWVARLSAGVAGAAVLIAAVTAFARLAGFGRVVVFSQTVGDTCLGTAYFTANQVPTILFEIVIGGALAGMVVPVLAGAIERGDREEVSRTSSALITWVLTVSIPLTLVLVLVALPTMHLLLGQPRGCDTDALLGLTVRFLLVFAPQIVLYGLAAVLYGILQAHRRFLSPALAPLLSSLVVIAAYLLFLPLGDGYQNDVALLPTGAELMLSVGTTVGVAALCATAAWPALRLGLRLRPTWRFPPGVAERARGLALAALLPLVGMQASQLLVIALANRGGGAGALALYHYAWALFTLPYGVIAIPIATSAFTTLSARHSTGDLKGYDRVLSVSARSTVLITGAAATALAAAAAPVAEVFAPGEGAVPLQRALLAFAPGIIGFGLVALLSRALYALHRGRPAATAQLAGWIIVMAANTAFVMAAPAEWTVAALGAGTSLGLTAAALLLLLAVRRDRGGTALAGLLRAGAAVPAGGGLGWAAGHWTVGLTEPVGVWSHAGAALAGGLVALGVFSAVALVLDRRAVRAVVDRRLRGAER